MPTKHLDIEEFVEFGYLHELNRQFLHPLGLALEITDDDGTHRLSGVQDFRDDPEGIIFAPGTLDEAKARRVALKQAERLPSRYNALGFFVQGV